VEKSPTGLSPRAELKGKRIVNVKAQKLKILGGSFFDIYVNQGNH
jgi:hypothetical protein